MILSTAFLETLATVTFTDAAVIDSYFIKNAGQDFITWFNEHAAGKQNWDGLHIVSGDNTGALFSQLWSNESTAAIFEGKAPTLLQFLALQSIIINETGGMLAPVTEAVGDRGHPGIAYAFDHIPGLKRSYNTMPGNKTCFTLFNARGYNKAFGSLPLGDALQNTKDVTWQGEAYPQQTFSTSTAPGITGYVLEADFFKFRGRGFIQTTGRSNYSQLVDYIINYTGANAVITGMKNEWGHISGDADTLSTISTNDNWETLFNQSDCIIGAKAIAIHNETSGRYLQQLSAADTVTMEGSLYRMGLRINGGNNYALLFRDRVLQLATLLQQKSGS